ncbi:MAG: hypothetical protein AAGD09_12050 [Cyanobacteria bacterium P01_F01_bin.56]
MPSAPLVLGAIILGTATHKETVPQDSRIGIRFWPLYPQIWGRRMQHPPKLGD